eukprot:CAMPEP_0183379230 /NCGR_PEP_ID=MMETSP0164_2-20130417/125323_1 /TAXON_ID=221442 /ORGANISM="Coccolithus pelagicus ssp braarudi, Strain PLY182g" /LENGTH=163 /DNA_ID=CAMNT_0025556811 /DNA_START=327 /DNA_END=819 /DNA_ORIENTATION=-
MWDAPSHRTEAKAEGLQLKSSKDHVASPTLTVRLIGSRLLAVAMDGPSEADAFCEAVLAQAAIAKTEPLPPSELAEYLLYAEEAFGPPTGAAVDREGCADETDISRPTPPTEQSMGREALVQSARRSREPSVGTPARRVSAGFGTLKRMKTEAKAEGLQLQEQ